MPLSYTASILDQLVLDVADVWDIPPGHMFRGRFPEDTGDYLPSAVITMQPVSRSRVGTSVQEVHSFTIYGTFSVAEDTNPLALQIDRAKDLCDRIRPVATTTDNLNYTRSPRYATHMMEPEIVSVDFPPIQPQDATCMVVLSFTGYTHSLE